MALDTSSFQSDFSVDDSTTNEIGTLKLSGELTIQAATSLKESILGALSKVNKCLLDLTQVRSFDLSSIQILYAAQHSAIENSKSIELTGSFPDSLKTAIFETGFDRIEWFGKTDF